MNISGDVLLHWLSCVLNAYMLIVQCSTFSYSVLYILYSDWNSRLHYARRTSFVVNVFSAVYKKKAYQSPEMFNMNASLEYKNKLVEFIAAFSNSNTRKQKTINLHNAKVHGAGMNTRTNKLQFVDMCSCVDHSTVLLYIHNGDSQIFDKQWNEWFRQSIHRKTWMEPDMNEQNIIRFFVGIPLSLALSLSSSFICLAKHNIFITACDMLEWSFWKT